MKMAFTIGVILTLAVIAAVILVFPDVGVTYGPVHTASFQIWVDTPLETDRKGFTEVTLVADDGKKFSMSFWKDKDALLHWLEPAALGQDWVQYQLTVREVLNRPFWDTRKHTNPGMNVIVPTSVIAKWNHRSSESVELDPVPLKYPDRDCTLALLGPNDEPRDAGQLIPVEQNVMASFRVALFDRAGKIVTTSADYDSIRVTGLDAKTAGTSVIVDTRQATVGGLYVLRVTSPYAKDEVSYGITVSARGSQIGKM